VTRHTVNVIAIDGPAASGKSSTAAAVAAALGFVHIDSGSLYRALTWVSVHHRTEEAATIIALAEGRHIGLRVAGNRLDVHVDDLGNVDAAIRTADVNASVSAVAAMPELRDWVNREIRRTIEQLPGAVIDGRDIGSIVVPDAALKIYLTASPATRAIRRLVQRGGVIDPGLLAAESAALAERDRRDSSRALAPLVQPPDAVPIDSTDLNFADQVDQIVLLARQRDIAARDVPPSPS
jgi:cytidylate kinase